MTKTVKKALSLILALLMVLSMMSVFCLPSFAAASFDTAYNGTTISKSALLVTSRAYGKSNNETITETWEGVSYTFTVGVNAFYSLSDAFSYASRNNINKPDIIVANWDMSKDLVVTASANIYAPNYATKPFNEDKTVNAATGTGENWTENTAYMNNQVIVRNIVFASTVSGGTVKLSGFTFKGSIDDSNRLKNSKATNITLENIMKVKGITDLSNPYVINCDNSNTALTNRTQKDVFTINNFYIESTSAQGLISENVPAYTTFDGLWTDAQSAGMSTRASYINQGADNAVFTIKNSNLRNFRRSDLNYNQFGLLYFEGRSKSDVTEGMYSAIVFDNNILHKFSGMTGGDGVTYVIGWHGNSYTDFRFTNNYFDHVSNSITTNESFIDTSRFFHTTIESDSNCDFLDYYGTAAIVGNTFNGCRLKFEITNNKKVVPYTLDVHDNYMVEHRAESLKGAIGGVPETHVLHERTDNVGAWLDFERTKSSSTIYPYTFSDDVVVDEENKIITYSVEVDSGIISIVPSDYGMGVDYSFDFSGIIKDNIYGNQILCYGASFGGYDMLSENVVVADVEKYIRSFEFAIKVCSPDGTQSESGYWLLNVEVSGYDIDSCEIFIDVKHGSWYEEYVNSAYYYGIMNGTNDGNTFEPNTTLSRAMTVTIIARMYGIDTDALRNTATKFTDVPVGKWYTGAVAWAVEAGITTGTSDTTFEPNADVTRQDTCVLLVRYADKVGITLNTDVKKTTFPDESKIGSWAKDAVYACQQAGIVNGNPDGTFDPRGNTTRSAAAKIFSVFFEDYILNK